MPKPRIEYFINMKNKVKYLIHKLFIYNSVDISDTLVLSCLTNLLIMYFPDFSKEDIISIMKSLYNMPYYIDEASLDITGLNNLLTSYSDYNELYLNLYELKKSLICSDSFEP